MHYKLIIFQSALPNAKDFEIMKTSVLKFCIINLSYHAVLLRKLESFVVDGFTEAKVVQFRTRRRLKISKSSSNSMKSFRSNSTKSSHLQTTKEKSLASTNNFSKEIKSSESTLNANYPKDISGVPDSSQVSFRSASSLFQSMTTSSELAQEISPPPSSAIAKFQQNSSAPFQLMRTTPVFIQDISLPPSSPIANFHKKSASPSAPSILPIPYFSAIQTTPSMSPQKKVDFSSKPTNSVESSLASMFESVLENFTEIYSFQNDTSGVFSDEGESTSNLPCFSSESVVGKDDITIEFEIKIKGVRSLMNCSTKNNFEDATREFLNETIPSAMKNSIEVFMITVQSQDIKIEFGTTERSLQQPDQNMKSSILTIVFEVSGSIFPGEENNDSTIANFQHGVLDGLHSEPALFMIKQQKYSNFFKNATLVLSSRTSNSIGAEGANKSGVNFNGAYFLVLPVLLAAVSFCFIFRNRRKSRTNRCMYVDEMSDLTDYSHQSPGNIVSSITFSDSSQKNRTRNFLEHLSCQEINTPHFKGDDENDMFVRMSFDNGAASFDLHRKHKTYKTNKDIRALKLDIDQQIKCIEDQMFDLSIV